MLNPHMAMFTEGNQISWLIGSFPISVIFSVWSYVVNGMPLVSASLTSVIVAFSNFFGGNFPQRPPIASMTPSPIGCMSVVKPEFNRPIFISTLLRAAILNAAFECSHLFTALFAKPNNFPMSFLGMIVWSWSFGTQKRSTFPGTKSTLSASVAFKFLSAPFADMLYKMFATSSNTTTTRRAKSISAFVESLKFLTASFTGINGWEVLSDICHIFSLVLTTLGIKQGGPPRVRHLSARDQLTQALFQL